MAEAGDGQLRSETRRRSREIKVRVTPEERARIERHAALHGHETAASFMRAVALTPAEPSPRVRQIVGLLGQIGGWLKEVDPILSRSNRAGAARLRKQAQMIAIWQRKLLGDDDARQGHQDKA
ncbi:hypothetical protein MLD63_16165 [Paracoccus sp. TK19116]|uniref:Mobilization protein n=1 Tax=Paracoccus albicereus TaxID=2922394 RepID=A0ABT1MW93_9RHOB|nr:hypothetical protein [Paracoccus albicereus]MCQ0971959.1 hypothetical protein [Paracoccus albicereus]